jgi:amidase
LDQKKPLSYTANRWQALFMLRFLALLLMVLSLGISPLFARSPTLPDVANRDAAALQRAMTDEGLTSVQITQAYLDRIRLLDDAGPALNAVIAVFPDALDQARALDAERAAGTVRGPLHGVPVLLKDNIEAAGTLATTAGSLALQDNVTNRDAFLVARLRAAGAVILGKANLSEWANIRSNNSTSGWSAVGGLTRNPHDLTRSACGSSSGSGAAVAASLAPLAIGTETDGSITCPAGANGIVGFKPTVGLVSRTHIVPVSSSQDTAGPMTLTVADAAAMLTVIAGTDRADSATKMAREVQSDYVRALRPDALKGRRIGVMMDRVGSRPDIAALFEAAIAVLAREGAEIIRIADTRTGLNEVGAAEFEVLLTELKADMAAYLASLPGTGMPRTLADLIAFNAANPAETRWFGQENFILADTKGGLDSPAYLAAKEKAARLAGPEGIDRLMKAHRVDILVGVTNGPAWKIDLVNGDNFTGPAASQLPAVAGYPHLTVPMGAVEGLPIGISFIGGKWADAEVLAVGHAYEQASKKRVVPGYRASPAD